MEQTKRKLSVIAIALILSLTLIIGVMASIAAPATETAHAAWDGEGNGTAESPYQIGTAAQLKKFRDIVNGTNGERKNEYACASLTADIDLACSEEDQWVPIGALDDADVYLDYNTNELGYLGVFDGNGHTVSGLYYNDTDSMWEYAVNDYIGLFGVVGRKDDDCGIVRNLTVAGSLAADECVGGIAGVLYGTVDNCVNNVTVTGDQHIGGIVGKATPGSVIRRSTNNGAVTGFGFLGGIVGYVQGYYNGETGLSIPSLVVNCVNKGTVNGTSYNYIGGIAGYLHRYVSVVYCYNAGTITVNYSSYVYESSVGGIVGRCWGVDENDSYDDAQALVENCYNIGDITAAQNSAIAGIVGTAGNSAMIRRCLNYGTLSITADTSSTKKTYGGVVSRSFYNGGEAKAINVYYKEGTAQFDGNATKKNATELKDKETFKDTTYWYSTGYYLDFEYCWVIGDVGPVFISADSLDVAYAISRIEKFINYDDYHFPDDGPMIYAAKKAYDLLSDEQKATLPEKSGNKLVEAVTVYAVLEKIHAVGKIYYSTDVKERLDAAQDAYDALSVEWEQCLPEYEVSDLKFYQKQYANAVALYDYLGRQGIGSDEDPFLISTKEQLARINDVISASYKLVCDIDAGCDADHQWLPIGTYRGIENDSYLRWSPYYEDMSECRGFTGVLDGDGHTISNLYIDVLDKVDGEDSSYYNHYASLIYSVGTSGKVKNLTVEGTFKGKSYVSGIAAINNGIIDGCVNKINLTGFFYMGGIAAYNWGQVINCKNFASVSGTTVQEGSYVSGTCGGIVGFAHNSVRNCTNSGNVTGLSRIGGIAGYNYGAQIWYCSNSGNVTGETKTGGIVGYMESPTDWFDFPVMQCYNSGTIVGTSDYTGGIVGQIEKPWGAEETGIENTYNTGTIQGTDYVGGLIGNLPYGCKIRVSHNVGAVSGTGSNVGQLTGKQESGSEIFISYYRSDTDTNSYAMTTEKFKNLSNFGGDNGSWRNGEVWMQGDDYPIFISAEMIKAREVSTYIGNIGSVSYTPGSKERIVAAKEAYDNLTEEEKALIPQEDREALEKAINDYNTVEAVVLLIDAIGEVSYPDSKDAIDDARDAVSNLDNDQKAMLGDHENTLKEAEADYAAGAIDAIGDVTYPDSKDAIDAAKAAVADLDAGQLALVGNLGDLEDAEKLYDAMGKIAAIGDVSYPDSKDAIDAAKAAVAALDDGQLGLVGNLGDLKDAEVDFAKGAIGAIGAVTYPGSKDALDAAKDAIADLDDDQLALVGNLDDLKDAEVDFAKGAIAAIGEATYPDSKDAIDAAKDAVADLDEEQLASVSNLDDLHNAEKAFAEAAIADIGEVAYPSSKDKIDLAKDMIADLDEEQLASISNLDDLYNAEVAFAEAAIDAIGEVSYPDSKDKIVAAREAYDAVDDKFKQNVNNYDELVDAEEKFVENVEALIEAIGTVEYSEACEEKIEAANEAYDALSEHLKSLVENADALQQANDDYYSVQDAVSAINAIGSVYYVDEIKNYIDHARELVDGLSDYQESILPEEYLKILVDDEAAYEAMGKINAISLPLENTKDCLDKVNDAEKFFNGLTEDQKDLIKPAFVSKLNGAVAVKNAIEAVNAIGEVENTPEDKDLIDDARELIDAVLNSDKLADLLPDSVVEDLENKETVYDALGEITTIGTPENTQAFRDKVADAKEAYGTLSADQKALVKELFVKELEDAEAIVGVMDEINEIGDVEYTDGSKDKIDAAREMYDALTEDQKAAFPADVLKTLVDAEKAYDAMDKICQIGTVEYTAECKAKIDIAMGAFEALTLEQKELVLNHTELPAAQAAYDQLAVNSVKTLIDAIGEAKHPKSKDAIQEARAAYDGLTEKQKELVDNYGKLTEAENIYTSYGKKGPAGTAMGWVIFALMILELLYLALYFILWYPKASAIAEKLKLVGLKPLLAKIVLFGFIDLLLLIGSAASVVIFILALVALAVYATPISIVTFIFAFLVMAAYGVLIFFNWKKRGPKEEITGESTAKEEDVEEDLSAGVSLKENIAIAKKTVSHSALNKQYVADYLKMKYAAGVECNLRGNETKTGLPLADTHYAVAEDDKKCFVYVYEVEGTTILLVKVDDEYGQKLAEKHPIVKRSAFPKSKSPWYSVIVDDSFAPEEIEKVLDNAYLTNGGKQAADEGLSLKESLAMAKGTATTIHHSKKGIADYLAQKYGDKVEINTRVNQTRTGLPLADTHYAVSEDGKKCFAYVYETNGTVVLLLRLTEAFAETVRARGKKIIRSAFPKSKDAWFTVIMDDTYTKDDIQALLDAAYSLAK